jgi:glycosyltransferase involved in cell wall biosynthesis
LSRQTYRDFDIVISYDRERGANWARNRGFKLVQTPFVLFSDDDIEWCPSALHCLKAALDAHPRASYSYGSYIIPKVGARSNVRFDPTHLRRMNYISTMSLVRTADFPGFDESIKRLQDWDLWLTMLEKGKTGVHCGSYIFQTCDRRGITNGGQVSWDQANQTVRRKHGLPQV